MDHAEADGKNDQKGDAQDQTGQHNATTDGFTECHARNNPDLFQSPPSFPTVSIKISSNDTLVGVIACTRAPCITRYWLISGTSFSLWSVRVNSSPLTWISSPQRAISSTILGVRPVARMVTMDWFPFSEARSRIRTTSPCRINATRSQVTSISLSRCELRKTQVPSLRSS